MSLDRPFIFPQKKPDIEVCSLGNLLHGFRRVVEAVRILAKALHDIVFKRNDKLRTAWITLPAGTTAKLKIDTAAFMPIGSDDMQSSNLGDAIAQSDIDAATRHIRGNRHRAAFAGHRNERRLTFFVSRIQNLMGRVPKQPAQALGLLHARRANQYRPARGMNRADLVEQCQFFFALRPENGIRTIDTNHRPISRDHFNAHSVKPAQFARLCGRGTSHTGCLRIERNQILQRDGSQNSSLRFHCYALFGFNCRMQSGGPATIVGNAALELVH